MTRQISNLPQRLQQALQRGEFPNGQTGGEGVGSTHVEQSDRKASAQAIADRLEAEGYGKVSMMTIRSWKCRDNRELTASAYEIIAPGEEDVTTFEDAAVVMRRVGARAALSVQRERQRVRPPGQGSGRRRAPSLLGHEGSAKSASD